MLPSMRVSSSSSSSFFASVVFFVAAFAGAAAAQDPCTDGDPETCNAEGQIVFCDGGTTATFDCADLAAGTTCGPAACGGSGCPAELVNRCVGARGDSCLGVATVFDGDSSNDQAQFMAVPCAAGDACLTTETGESCGALPSGVSACTASSISCSGRFVVACQGYSAATNAVAAPGVFDCGLFGAGFVCQEDAAGEVTGCGNPDCGSAGAGKCDGTTAISCSEGVENGRENCATTGEACVQDSPDVSPTCVLADTRCGTNGGGACAGNVATICTGGQFTTTTDCAANGLVCGTIPDTTRIGCVEPGAQEGEGDGGPADECDSDSDCDDDEECDDGECVDADGGGPRRGGDPEPVPTPGLFSCAAAGAFPAGSVVAAGLALALRRRRRR